METISNAILLVSARDQIKVAIFIPVIRSGNRARLRRTVQGSEILIATHYLEVANTLGGFRRHSDPKQWLIHVNGISVNWEIFYFGMVKTRPS
jgi:hypothetical protein